MHESLPEGNYREVWFQSRKTLDIDINRVITGYQGASLNQWEKVIRYCDDGRLDIDVY